MCSLVAAYSGPFRGNFQGCKNSGQLLGGRDAIVVEGLHGLIGSEVLHTLGNHRFLQPATDSIRVRWGVIGGDSVRLGPRGLPKEARVCQPTPEGASASRATFRNLEHKRRQRLTQGAVPLELKGGVHCRSVVTGAPVVLRCRPLARVANYEKSATHPRQLNNGPEEAGNFGGIIFALPLKKTDSRVNNDEPPGPGEFGH